MIDVPNIRHLRAVSTVASLRSVNGAAEVLRLSRPAVTLAVRHIEEICGADLFVRHKSGIYATDAGEVFIRRIDRSLSELARGLVGAGDKEGSAVERTRQFSTSQITAVAALYDTLDWAGAAEMLGVSVQSVKRTIRSVDLLLQSPVLQPAASGVQLSVEGIRLARGAKLAIREIELGFEELAHLRGGSSGTLRIGAMPLARAQILPETITRILASFPDLKVVVQEGSYEYLLDLLRNGDVDLMVGALRGNSLAPDVTEEVLMRVPLSVVARQGHPLQNKPDLTLADTVPYQWIVNTVGSPSRTLFGRAFRDRGLALPERVLEIGTLGVIRGLLLRGDLLTMLSRHQIYFEEEVGKLVVLDIDLPETVRAIGASTRRGWQPTRPQDEFLTLLRAVCHADPARTQTNCDEATGHLRVVHDARRPKQ